MKETIFEDYLNNLTKSKQNIFHRVLDFYKELKPRYYKDVIKSIESTKCADSTKQLMHEYNNYIYEMLFEKLGFKKSINGLSIGDTIYMDHSKNIDIITEFIEKENQVYIVLNPRNSLFDGYPLIEMISKEERPKGDSQFKSPKNRSFIDDLILSQITSTVASFLREYSVGTYDFDPFYQRELVWTISQKEAFIKALLTDKTDVRPTFLDNADDGVHEYEVLDGKQRLHAILSYIKGEFSVDGLYYSDLNGTDTYRFMNTPMVYTLVKYYTDKGQVPLSNKQKVELFLQVNQYGQHVSDEHLARIKEQYLP